MENGFNDRDLLDKLNKLITTQEFELNRLKDALIQIKDIATTLEKSLGFEPAQASSTAKASLKVMLIEDDDLAQLGANSSLNQIACEIIPVKTVAEALALLQQQVFDIILCDMNLPDGDGLDIIDAVKKDASHPNYRTPFIALTADNDKGRTLVAEQHGFDLYLVKPLTQASAKAVIDVYAFNLAADIKGEIFPRDSQAVIDLEQAEAISGCDKEMALALIGRLVHEFPGEQAELVQAYHTNNVKAVKDTLHRLRGGASYCGVPQLKAAIQDLNDQVIDAIDLNKIEPAFLRVYREIDAVKRVYESLSHSHQVH